MDNVITINLKEKQDGEHDYYVNFESSPTISEIVASYLILKLVMENNFDRTTIYTKCAAMYERIRDIEEVMRIP